MTRPRAPRSVPTAPCLWDTVGSACVAPREYFMPISATPAVHDLNVLLLDATITRDVARDVLVPFERRT